MKQAKSMAIALAVTGLVAAGVSWSDLRRGYEDARASRDASAVVPRGASSHSSQPASAALPREPAADASATTQGSSRISGPRKVGEAASAERDSLAASAEFLLARALVLDHLRDPSTAEFRHERALQGGEIICMEVNSKDGFGGDVGFTQAVVIARPDAAPVVWVDNTRQHIARAACETA